MRPEHSFTRLLDLVEKHKKTPEDDTFLVLLVRNRGDLEPYWISCFPSEELQPESKAWEELPLYFWVGLNFHRGFRTTDVCTKEPESDIRVWYILAGEKGVSCFWPALSELLKGVKAMGYV